MRKRAVVISVLVFLFVLTNLSGCGSNSPSDSASPSAATPNSSPTASASQPSSEPSSKLDAAEQTSADDNSDNEAINIDDIKADFYYEYLIVETYIKSRITAVNYNNFDHLSEYLDVDSDIFTSEKQYITNYVSKGIQLELIALGYEDLRPVTDNLYDVYYSVELKESSPNNTTGEKTLYQKFTVFDDGIDLKITNIESLAKDYVEIGEKAAKDCLIYMFGSYNADGVTDTLGEPEKEVATTYYHRWYFKQGIEIDVGMESSYNQDTGKLDETLFLKNYVYLNNQCTLKTDRGIGIGSTYDEVMSAHANEIYPELTNRDLITIGACNINFVLKDDKVSSIYIRTWPEMVSPEYYGDFKPDRL